MSLLAFFFLPQLMCTSHCVTVAFTWTLLFLGPKDPGPPRSCKLLLGWALWGDTCSTPQPKEDLQETHSRCVPGEAERVTRRDVL